MCSKYILLLIQLRDTKCNLTSKRHCNCLKPRVSHLFCQLRVNLNISPRTVVDFLTCNFPTNSKLIAVLHSIRNQNFFLYWNSLDSNTFEFFKLWNNWPINLWQDYILQGVNLLLRNEPNLKLIFIHLFKNWKLSMCQALSSALGIILGQILHGTKFLDAFRHKH